jgi:hypothetical protein
LNQRVAGNALANATPFSVPLTLDAPVEMGLSDVLSTSVEVRRAGLGGVFGVRLWYGNSLPPVASKRGWSRFAARFGDTESHFYYRGAACPQAPCARELDAIPGAAGVASIVRAMPGYLSFGTWFTTPIIVD